jgi:hypothetical protein
MPYGFYSLKSKPEKESVQKFQRVHDRTLQMVRLLFLLEYGQKNWTPLDKLGGSFVSQSEKIILLNVAKNYRLVEMRYDDGQLYAKTTFLGGGIVDLMRPPRELEMNLSEPAFYFWLLESQELGLNKLQQMLELAQELLQSTERSAPALKE